MEKEKQDLAIDVIIDALDHCCRALTIACYSLTAQVRLLKNLQQGRDQAYEVAEVLKRARFHKKPQGTSTLVVEGE